MQSDNNSANSWHSNRRKLISKAHPEILELCNLKDNRTLYLVAFITPIHLSLAIVCGWFDLSWSIIFCLAALIGGPLVFQMFNNGHELCHDAICEAFKPGWVKSYILHWILLPDVNPMQWM
jgi:fatty acid desaturase